MESRLAEGESAMRRLTRTGHFRDPNLEQQIERIRREALEEAALAEHEQMTGGTHGIPRNSQFESTAGAQQKADKALADAKAYTDQEEIARAHVLTPV